MRVEDLGRMAYRDAWVLQEAAHQQVLAGGEERLLLVEHPPVITFGRRPGVARNLVASDEQLAKLGVEVVQSDRGGDITFHGPGQIVAYPIVRLNDHGLSVGAYVHGIERAVVATLADFGIEAAADPTAVGVWTDDAGISAKICAIGVRIKRGISLHGLALNVETNLVYFNLIVPCGLAGRPVTSMRKLLGQRTPSIEVVKASLARHLGTWLKDSRIGRAISTVNAEDATARRAAPPPSPSGRGLG
ncbi:MAG TPA: lipoyl(octanoyl) transferase LipB [Tepidisphaeraceae bacterium]|jgi:lipoyl(octanoyl) transferase